MTSRPKQLAVVLSLAFLIGALIDIFYFSSALPRLSNAIGLKCDLILFGVALKMPRFGALPTVFFSLLVLMALLLIWAGRPSRDRLKAVGQDWLVITILLFLTPVFLVIGGFIYKLSKTHLPDWLKSVVESFGITCKVYFGKDYEFVTLEGSLAALLGLGIGFIVLYYYGLRRVAST